MHKILIASRHFWPEIGGAERQAERLARGLANIGWKVTVLTGRTSATVKFEERRDGYTVRRLFYPPIRFLGSLIYLTKLFWYLAHHEKEYDLIFSLMLKQTTAVSVLAGMLTRRPVVARPAGGGPFGDVAYLKKAPFGRLYLSFARRASAVIALTRQIRAELLEEGFSNVRIWDVPNGVEIPEEPPADKSKAKAELGLPTGPILLFVGRLAPEKGIRELLDVWRELKEANVVGGEYPRACLVVVGDGPLNESLLEKVSKERMEEFVELVGAVHDVEPYYRAADIFVLPSFSEGMSVSLLEAMAHGLPSIATRVGGTPEVIEDGRSGILVPTAPSEWKEALTSLMRDKERSQRLGEQARKRVEERFSLGQMLENYIRLFERLLAKEK